jgi:hypothetical protein
MNRVAVCSCLAHRQNREKCICETCVSFRLLRSEGREGEPFCDSKDCKNIRLYCPCTLCADLRHGSAYNESIVAVVDPVVNVNDCSLRPQRNNFWSHLTCSCKQRVVTAPTTRTINVAVAPPATPTVAPPTTRTVGVKRRLRMPDLPTSAYTEAKTPRLTSPPASPRASSPASAPASPPPLTIITPPASPPRPPPSSPIKV